MGMLQRAFAGGGEELAKIGEMGVANTLEEQRQMRLDAIRDRRKQEAQTAQNDFAASENEKDRASREGIALLGANKSTKPTIEKVVDPVDGSVKFYRYDRRSDSMLETDENGKFIRNSGRPGPDVGAPSDKIHRVVYGGGGSGGAGGGEPAPAKPATPPEEMTPSGFPDTSAFQKKPPIEDFVSKGRTALAQKLGLPEDSSSSRIRRTFSRLAQNARAVDEKLKSGNPEDMPTYPELLDAVQFAGVNNNVRMENYYTKLIKQYYQTDQ